jgi:hypothetical protein
MGGHIRKSWWAYAKASMPLVGSWPERGFDIPALARWRYVPLTPFVIREEFLFSRILPFSILNNLSRRLSPTLVYVWIKPSESKKDHSCVVSAA